MPRTDHQDANMLLQPLQPMPQPAPGPAVSPPMAAKAMPYRPLCLMTWRAQVAAMDETAGLRPSGRSPS